MARHYSPPGTFEAIRKEVIEDPMWGESPAAFYLMVYLTTKPEGWVLHVKYLADATGLKESTVTSAIRVLRRRSLVYDEQVRTPDGRKVERWEVRFRRSQVVATLPPPPKAKPQVGSTPPENGGVDPRRPARPRKPAANPQVPAPPPASPQAGSTPPENGGVDPAANPQVSDPETHRRRSGQPPDFSLALRKIAPIREDGLKELKNLNPREDGSKDNGGLTPPAPGPHDRLEQDMTTTPETGTRDGEIGGDGALPGMPPSSLPALTEPETAPAAPTAQTLIAEWIDHCRHRPPGRVIGQVAKALGEMLDEGQQYEHVRAGLAAWHLKGNVHPSALPSFVNTAANGSGGTPADERVLRGMALTAELRRREEQEAGGAA